MIYQRYLVYEYIIDLRKHGVLRRKSLQSQLSFAHSPAPSLHSPNHTPSPPRTSLMRILETRTMRGPNFWSVRQTKLIVAKVAFDEYSALRTTDLPGFERRFLRMFPEFARPRPTLDDPGMFLDRVREGTTMCQVMMQAALELQCMAGMPVNWGRAYPVPHEDGADYVVFAYQEADAGRYALKAALEATQALVTGKDKQFDLKKHLAALHEIREDEFFGPSTWSIVTEAASRGIPYLRLPHSGMVQFGYGVHQQRISATITGRTGNPGVEMAGDKALTKAVLDGNGVPVPKGALVRSVEGLKDAVEELGYPLVLKPLDGNHGKGASIGIKTWKEALAGLKAAQVYSEKVIVEQFIEGFDYRMLVIDGKLIAAAKRTPAAVTGDGRRTIKQLIEEVNKDPRRGVGHAKELTRITVDRHTRRILQSKNLTVDSVLPDGETFYLKSTANISTGGTATDVTDIVHPYNQLLAERVAGIVGLDVCGIDVMTTDIAIPLPETRGAVLEVNAAPGFRMHLAPTEGLPRNVAAPVVDMLFPPGAPFRIPIVAVTGTNGKTTTTRLIAHMATAQGFKVGYTTTDGIYIQGQMLEKGDTTGSQSAEFVLRDPTVNFAVLETARGGLLRAGLGFNQCDIAIVTNVAADHLGLRGIHTVEEMAEVKGVLPRTVRPGGYAILNADDDLVYKMSHSLECNVALFSLDEKNPRVLEHVAAGGLGAVYEEGYISIYRNSYNLRVDRAADVPITLGGRARFNIENALAATLAGYIQRFPIDDIRRALRTFVPDAATTPGRMNIFRFPDFEVVVDYAHNTAGLSRYGEYLRATPAQRKVGIVAGLGDRRDEDTITLGRTAGELFDEVILKQETDLRGRSADDITRLLRQGLTEAKPSIVIDEVTQETVAVARALEHARPGDHITVLAENIDNVNKLIADFLRISLRSRPDTAPSEVGPVAA